MSAGDPIKLGTANNGLLVASAGAVLTKGTAGKLDVLRRPFTCKTSSIVSQIPALYGNDSVFTAMALSEYRITNLEGVHSELELIYKGLASGSPEAAYSEDGLALSTAQTTADVGGNSVNLEIQYYAPSTSWAWVATADPRNTVQYASVLSTLNPFDFIVGYRITTSDGSNGWASYSDFVAALNTLSVQTLITNYKATLVVPNRYWECESTAVRSIH